MYIYTKNVPLKRKGRFNYLRCFNLIQPLEPPLLQEPLPVPQQQVLPQP